MKQIPLGFVPEPLLVPLAQLFPSRKTPQAIQSSRKFKQIKASIGEVGLIEPLTIIQPDKKQPRYLILDGHIRLVALQDLGFADAPCLMATDDESYTYNNRVNRLATIQEHYMIRRAVERGFSADRIANALAVSVQQIMAKVNLLDGICPEAVELLKVQHFSADVGRVLRKMKPLRQVECVETMISANSLTASFAEALLAGTPPEELVESKAKKVKGVSAEQMAHMEREMSNLYEQYKVMEESFGQDTLVLVLARGYLAKLMDNKAVAKYLRTHQPDVATQFETIVATEALSQ